MLLEGGGRTIRWYIGDVVRTLKHLGTTISDRLSSLNDPTATDAINLWTQQNKRTVAK
jgi:hypothetical protein